jgi:hypothetical protein
LAQRTRIIAFGHGVYGMRAGIRRQRRERVLEARGDVKDGLAVHDTETAEDKTICREEMVVSSVNKSGLNVQVVKTTLM